MAFYDVRFRYHGLDPDPVLSFGLTFETEVVLDANARQDIADTCTTEWLTHVGLFNTSISLMPCTIQQFERHDRGPQPANWDTRKRYVRYVRKPLTVVQVGAGAEAAGTVVGDSLPPQCSLVVGLYTNTPGRHAHGRAYTPPPPESVSNSNGAITDYVARASMVQQCAEAAEGALAGLADVDHVVYSLVHDQQFEVVNYIADSQVDSQRRRQKRS